MMFLLGNIADYHAQRSAIEMDEIPVDAMTKEMLDCMFPGQIGHVVVAGGK